MARGRHALSLVLAGIVAAGGMIAAAAPASAAPTTVTLAGSAPSPVSGPSSEVFRYTLTTGGPLTGVVFSTHQDAALPAQQASVTVDGAAVPSADVTVTGGDISFPVAAGTLSAGAHKIAFKATVGSAAAATSSNATVAFTDPADPSNTSVDSAAVTVKINEPDLVLYGSKDPSSTTVPVMPLGTKGLGSAFFLAGNLGKGSVPATLTLHLPANVQLLELDAAVDDFNSQNETQLNCPATAPANGVLSCPLGALTPTNIAFVEAIVTTAGTPPIGATQKLTAELTADDNTVIEGDTTNNSAEYDYRFTGTANLTRSLSASKTTVTIGSTTTVTLTVHNNGPQPAVSAMGVVLLENTRFKLGSFSGKQLDLDALFGSGSSSSSGSGAVGVPLSVAAQARVAEARRLRTSTVAAARQNFRSAIASGKSRAQAHAGAVALTQSLTSAGAAGGTFVAAATKADDWSQGLLWDLGTIGVGQTKSATLTVKAGKTGKDRVALVSLSSATDPRCSTEEDLGIDAPNPKCVGLLTLTAKAKPTASTASAGAALANTGPAGRAPLGLGLALLLAGTALSWVARRRTSARG